jgi:hypothetical protein
VVFERDLLSYHGARRGSVPVLRNFTIYPPDGQGQVWLTGEKLVKVEPVRPDPKDPDRLLPAEAHYGKFFMRVPQPYAAALHYDGPPDPNLTIEKYLGHLKATRPEAKFEYHYAWWKQKSLGGAAGMAAGLVLIGGVWPTVLGLLAGAGFGRPPRPEKAYDLDRFSHAPDPAKPAAASASPEQDAALHHHIEELEDELLANLRRSDAIRREEPLEDERPVRDLKTSPLEPAPVADKKGEDVEFTGEFYPVAHKVAKQGDGHATH